MADGRLDLWLPTSWRTGRHARKQMAGKAMIVAMSREAAVRLVRRDREASPGVARRHRQGTHQDRDDEQLVGPGALPAASHRLASPSSWRSASRTRRSARPRHRPRHVADRLRRAAGAHAVRRQADAGARPDAGHRSHQPHLADKPGGLIVDYIGIGEELKKAIRQYTRDAGRSASRSTPPARRCAVLLDTLDVIRKEFFHGFDYAASRSRSAPCRC
jgi:type I restriction enzyme R subunit